MSLATSRDKSPELFEMHQELIDRIKNKKNFPERSIDKFAPSAVRNLNNKAANRLTTGWESAREKPNEFKVPAHYHMVTSGLKDALQYSDIKMLSPDSIIENKMISTPRGTVLNTKIK
jgi:hypothetical protein